LRIDIDTSDFTRIAGLVESKGYNSAADLKAITTLTILEGGIVAARDTEGQIQIEAGQIVTVEAGGAVTAGAKFIDVDGKPVAVKTGEGADVRILSPHELVIKGTVTSSDQMVLKAGAPLNHYASSYFNNLPVDGKGNDHYLKQIGENQFSILLTGTLTSLADNTTLNLSADNDIIIRGNINVLGENSNLKVQSKGWVYHEGMMDVRNNLTIQGGYDAQDNVTGGANSEGSSVYVHATAITNTKQSGSQILIQGAKDIDLHGVVVAGGTIGANGVTWAGNDSGVTVTAGEQVYLDTGLLASKFVMVNGGQGGADDNGLGVLITTVGGITAGGYASDNTGAIITVNSTSNLEMMGWLVSGGKLLQTFDNNGKLKSQTIDWSDNSGTIRVNAQRQAFIGGNTTNRDGAAITTGGYLYAHDRIEIQGGATDQAGVYVQAASELVTHAANGSILVRSGSDADIQGLLLPGGDIAQVRDLDGVYLGRTLTHFNGDSTIRIEAEHQIRIGQDLRAGKQIDLVGGEDPVDVSPRSGRGIVLYGSTRLETWQQNSQINLNAPGQVDILAPAHTNEIVAGGFVQRSNGRIDRDVTLKLWMNKVGFEVEANVTLNASATADNKTVEDLMRDLQQSLDTAAWTVVRSTNPNHPVGSSYSSSVSDPDLKVKLHNGQFLLAGPYSFLIKSDSTNADQLGFTNLSSNLTSSLPYTISAKEVGSTVSIGAPDGPNGKLYIAGKVLSYNALNLYSGTSPDGIDIEIDASGRLETINASISMNVGQFGVVKGELIAGGTGSDIVLSSENTLQIHGSLTANDEIRLNAGTAMKAGETSIATYGTSRMNAQQVTITGLNDVIIDSSIGEHSLNLKQIEITSTAGKLEITRTSGRLVSGADIILIGQDVVIAGVVRNLASDGNSATKEVTIRAANSATVMADLVSQGSVLIEAGNSLDIYNGQVLVQGAGETLEIRQTGANGQITLGRAVLVNNQLQQQGGVLAALDGVTVQGGDVMIGSGVQVISSGNDSAINVSAATLTLVGGLYGGAAVNDINSWIGQQANVNIMASEAVVIGGLGVENGQIVSRGGSIESTGSLNINVTGGSSVIDFSLSNQSYLKTQSMGGAASQITISTGRDAQVFGLIESVDDGSDVTIRTGGLLLVDGYIKAEDSLTVEGGKNTSGYGLIMQPLRYRDSQGRLVDASNFYVDVQGNYVDQNGNRLASGAAPVSSSDLNLSRVSGGTLETNDNGTIKVSAEGSIVISGNVAPLQLIGSVLGVRAAQVSISSNSDVTIDGTVGARNQISITAENLNLVKEGLVKTYDNNGSIYLRGEERIFLDHSLVQPNRTLVETSGNLQVDGSHLWIDGFLKGGNVLINAAESVVVTGNVRSEGDLSVRAGVDLDWSTEKLRGLVMRAELTGGNITVTLGGLLDGAGKVSLLAGNNVNVKAESALQAGTKAGAAPFLSQKPTLVSIVTGTYQVANGTIEVPVVTWIPTTVTEQVGYDTVKTGNEFFTMDITLKQDGYWNPATNTKREWFVNKVDYTINSINWGSVARPTNDNHTFNDLTDAQRDRVMQQLGYFKLYDFNFANAKAERTINGNPTSNDIYWKLNEAQESFEMETANGVTYRKEVIGGKDYKQGFTNGVDYTTNGVNWGTAGRPADNHAFEQLTQAQKDAVARQLGYARSYDFATTAVATDIVNVNVDGWQDKYLRMPQGMTADILSVLRVVSQGEAQVSQEWVGDFWDRATVQYYQDRSSLEARYEDDAWIDDYDDSPARWAVTHSSNGRREYNIFDQRGIVNHTQTPLWNGQSSVQQNDRLGRNTFAPSSYFATTDTIAFQFSLSPRYNVSVGYDPHSYQTFDWEQWGSGKVTFYQHSDFTGHQYSYTPGNYATVPSNDSASGIRWQGGMKVVAYEHSNFGGTTWTFGDGPSPGGWNDKISSIKVYQWQGTWHGAGLSETQYDYLFNWKSLNNRINDNRLTLSYQWVSNAQDIYDNRPRYETKDILLKHVATSIQTNYETRDIVQNQVIWTTDRLAGDQNPFGAFASDSIRATNAIVIDAGNDVAVSAKLGTVGTSGTISINAVGTANIQGSRPDGATANTIVAPAILNSQNGITVTANQLNVTDASELKVSSSSAQILLRSTADLSFSGVAMAGNTTTTGQVKLEAGANLALTGQVLASTLDAKAGLASGTGDITGSALTFLSGNQITLTAGATGDIDLSSAWVTGSTVSLTASNGSINNYKTGTDANGELIRQHGLITATNLTLSASSAISANLSAAQLTASGSAVDLITMPNGSMAVSVTATNGDLSLTSLGAIQLQQFTTSGDINLMSLGNVTLNQMQAGGDVTLTLLQNLAVGNLTANGAVDLSVQGNIAQANGTTISAAALTLATGGNATLTTAVSTLTLNQLGTGNLTIRNTAANLTINDADLSGGTLNLSTSGNLNVGDLQFLTDVNGQAIRLNAAGNLVLNQIDAGANYGAIELTASSISAVDATNQVLDLVGKSLKLNAAQINPLELSVEELGVRTTGTIELHNAADSTGRVRSLAITEAISTARNVIISNVGTLVTTANVEAGGGTIELSSQTGNLTVIPGPNGDRLLKSANLSLRATQQVVIDPRVALEADNLELGYGKSGILQGSVQLPDIRTKNLTLELGSGNINISPETFLNSDGTPLALQTINLVARGNQVTSGAMAGYYRYRDVNTQATYYLDQAELEQGTKVYREVNGNLTELSTAEVNSLRLAPVLNTITTQIREPMSGWYTYKGNDGREYYKERPDTTAVYTRQNAAGLYSYTVLDPTLTDANGNSLALVYKIVYSAESDYSQFIQQNPQYDDVQIKFTEVNAAPLNIQAKTIEETAGGIQLVTPTGLLRDPRLGFPMLANSISLKAQRDLGNISFADIQGRDVTIASGADLVVTGAPTVQNTLTLTSTGYFNPQGQLIGGRILTNGATLAAASLNLTALSEINIDTNVSQLSANITNSGSLIIREADSITLNQVVVANGDLTLTAGGTVTLNQVTVSNQVNLTGQQVNSFASDGRADLTAAGLTLRVTNGVGYSNQLLETSVKTVNIIAGGAAHLSNYGGLSVTGVTAGNAVQIETHSPLTVTGAISAGANVRLSAGEQSGAGDDLTINANVIATSGSILLQAGDDITIRKGVTIQAPGQITIEADQSGQDRPVGSTIQLSGTFIGSSMTVRGGINDDTINLASTNTQTTILTQGGHDVVNLGDENNRLNRIQASLIIDTSAATDTLNIYNQGDGSNSNVRVTATQISGLAGMGGNITYQNVEYLNLNLGAGNNLVNVADDITAQIDVQTGSGRNTVLLDYSSSSESYDLTYANGQITGFKNAGSLQYQNFATLDLRLGSGNDSFTVKDANFTYNLLVQGNGGTDRLFVDFADHAGYQDTVTVTNSMITGLGVDSRFQYSGMDQIAVQLGAEQDAITLVNHYTGNLDFNTGAGDDAIMLTNAAGQTRIVTEAGQDTVLIQSINAATTVELGAGDDTIRLSDGSNTVNSISALLTVVGGEGQDGLEVNDSGDATNNAATLTNSSLTGLGMSAGVQYSGLETLDIQLGSGNDAFTIRSIATTVVLSTGSGNDQINLGNLANQLNDITNALMIDGGAGSDVLNLDDSGDSQANSGTVSRSQITGFGLGAGITYSNLDALNLWLGSAQDQLSIGSIQVETTVDTAAGDDHVTIGDAVNAADLNGATLTLTTQAGDDQVMANVQNGAWLVNLGAGADSLEASVSNLQRFAVIGGTGADQITIDRSTNTQAAILTDEGTIEYAGQHLARMISTGAGDNDMLQLNSGTNTVLMGGGSDRIDVTDGLNTVFTDDGEVLFDAAGQVASISSTSSGTSDQISLQGGANTVIAGAGADEIQLGGGTNVVMADEAQASFNAGVLTEIQSSNPAIGGDDSITLTGGTQIMIAGAGSDQITTEGAGLSSVVIGDNGIAQFHANGKLKSMASNDSEFGSTDRITLNGGMNTVIAGTAKDIVIASGGQNTAITDDGEATFDLDGKLETMTSNNSGNGSDDKVILLDGTNTIITGTGDDEIKLNGGYNVVLSDEAQARFNAGSLTGVHSLNPDAGGSDSIAIRGGFNTVIAGANTDEIVVRGAATESVILSDSGVAKFDANSQLSSVSSLRGAAGSDDQIHLLDGTNTVIAGGGADTVSVTAGQNTVLGDDGQAGFNAAGHLTLVNSANSGNGAADQIRLNGGKNAVIAGAGADSIQMNGGYNVVMADEALATLNDGTLVELASTNPSAGSADVVRIGNGYNVAVGGTGDDQIAVNSSAPDAQAVVVGDNTVLRFHPDGSLQSVATSGSGADQINLSNGSNTVIAGGGTDTVTIQSGHNAILTDDSTATFEAGQLTSLTSADSANGAADTVTLQAGSNLVITGAGDDTIQTLDGNNVVVADEATANFTAGELHQIRSINPAQGGNDQITLGQGYNVVIGGAGSDTVVAEAIAVNLIVGDNATAEVGENGKLTSIASSDSNTGAADRIELTGGTNMVIAGDGKDMIAATTGNNAILTDAGRAEFDRKGHLKSIVSTQLGQGISDAVTLQDGSNTVIAGGGDDQVSAVNGVNTIIGDEGEALYDNGMLTAAQAIAPELGGIDRISTQGGTNVIIGGAGDDQITVRAQSSAEANVVFGDSGIAKFDSDNNLHAIASLRGATGGQDQIFLTQGSNTVIAGGGQDQVSATEGNNVIFGDDAQAEMSHARRVRSVQSTNLGQGDHDQIELTSGENLVVAGAGDDQVRTVMPGQNSDSSDWVFGDEAQVKFTSDTLEAISLNLESGGSDVIQNQSEQAQMMVGGNGADHLTTQNDQDLLIGGNARTRSFLGQMWQTFAELLPGQQDDDDLLNGGNRKAPKQ
jgi:hypothetical protein